ncbi:MAG: D-alanyl-D-alanine carboxypeptidase [Alphaproteobacteria bacterium]|nr:D-alanyl-D-alanine carboxypeptidase [Alphaproteobacteria bacterium]
MSQRSPARFLSVAAIAIGLAAVAAFLPVTGSAQQAEPAKKPAAAKHGVPAKKAPAKETAAKPAAPATGAETGTASSSNRGPTAFESEARNALLIDFQTGAVLYEKAADERVGPASMSKMMTTHMVFEQIKAGKLKMDDTLPISDKTWKQWNNSGSTMFIPVGARVRVDDLLRGVIIQSGNDACVVFAEGLYGSEEAFAAAMNRRAKELGLVNSNFTNATGWPDPNHYMTARDLATLGRHLITDFPDLYKIYSEKEFTYNGIKQGNRNPLIYKDSGTDGIKTGHTEEVGYGLTASAVRNGRRLILVVHGLKSMKQRSAEAERLMDYGFREFNNYVLFKAGDKAGDAEVWLGEKLRVGLRVDSDAVVTLPRAARKDLKVQVVTQEPIPAPIRKGQELGKLIVSAPGMANREIPLLADADIEKLGVFAKMGATLAYVVLGSRK